MSEFSTFHKSDPSKTQTFRGRPSKGCNKCRSRKVKCDEGHPTCQRCEKSGIPCVYRDEFDLFLRNQTDKAAESAQKKWRSRSKKSGCEERSSPESSDSSRERSKSKELVILDSLPQRVSLSPSLSDIAYNRFLYDYVISPHPFNPHSCFFGYVPTLGRKGAPGSCISSALSAAAFANLAGRCNSEEAKLQSVEEYGKAVQSLKTTLATPGKDTAMETLATSVLLGIYELQTTPYLTHGGSWSAHINGSVAILINNYSTKRITNDVGGLFQTILSQMLVNRMSRGERPTIPFELCSTFVPHNALANLLYRMMYKTANMVADWKEAQNAAQKLNDLEDLLVFSRQFIHDAQTLDSELEAWMRSRPASWDVQKLDNCDKVVPKWLKGLYSSQGAPQTLHMHNGFHIAHRWAFWRACRITLHCSILDAVALQVSHATSIEDQNEYLIIQRVLEVRLYDLVDGIAEGLFASLTVPIPGKADPTSVSDVVSIRAFTLLWPVFRAAVTLRREPIRRLDIHQRFEWLKSAMEFLGADLSVAKAKGFIDVLDGLYDHTTGMGVEP